MSSIAKRMNLGGKVALVTGAGGHVGQVVARTLAELGAGVAALDVNEERVATRSLPPTSLPFSKAVRKDWPNCSRPVDFGGGLERKSCFIRSDNRL